MKITSAFERDFLVAVGYLLEALFGGFDEFVDDIDVDLSELSFKMVVDDFIDFSEDFSEFGVEVIFHTVVWPTMGWKVTCRGDEAQYWPIYCQSNHEVE